MTAKEKIFAAFSGNVAVPGSLSYVVPLQHREDRTVSFIEMATKAGSACQEVTSVEGIRSWIESTSSGSSIVSKLPEIKDNLPHDFNNEFDFLIVGAAAGIAENGAVWLDDAIVPERRLLFLCKHLVIVLREDDIVADLMEADIRTRSLNVRYGLLISGPSKTADIEQSLVMGAQGPISSHVFILKSPAREGIE